MKSGLSMTSRAEVTTRYARSFRAADKRTKGRILDEVVSVTGWSRDNARRRLTSAAQSPPGAGRSVTTRPRKQRATKFSYDALKVLQRVWAASGGQCGKYLAASMRMQLDGLERHGELVDGVGRYSMAVREELLASLRAPASRPGVWAYRHDQDLAVTVRIRLHRHVADNHAPWCLTSRCPRKLIGASRRNARERGGQLALIRMPLRTSGRAVGTVAR